MQKSVNNTTITRGPTCSVTSTLRRSYDTSDLCGIAQKILGSTYHLSVVLIGDKKARLLNKAHRNKDTAANVLSFPLDHTQGEIFLNVARIIREAHTFDLTPEGHLRYLLIHGCLHLKGHSHGGTMEEAERRFVKKFSLR
ncbi:MAG: rRNA maturation RNase YbeY [Candidatus Pacebacteria bacterium]|nr:rRNA maturation RNase YbeY [Candidatus Paceibacterota bacterium]